MGIQADVILLHPYDRLGYAEMGEAMNEKDFVTSWRDFLHFGMYGGRWPMNGIFPQLKIQLTGRELADYFIKKTLINGLGVFIIGMALKIIFMITRNCGSPTFVRRLPVLQCRPDEK